MAQLLRGVLGSLSLEVFRGRGDVALRDVVSGHGGVGILQGFSNPNGSAMELNGAFICQAKGNFSFQQP